MRLLLDTHVLIWTVEQPHRVPDKVARLIKSDSNDVFVSAGSAWEIGTKVRIGKLSFDQAFLDDFDNRLRSFSFEPLVITAAHAAAAARLPGVHKDPFDRLLVGQALSEGLIILTADRALTDLGARVIW